MRFLCKSAFCLYMAHKSGWMACTAAKSRTHGRFSRRSVIGQSRIGLSLLCKGELCNPPKQLTDNLKIASLVQMQHV